MDDLARCEGNITLRKPSENERETTKRGSDSAGGTFITAQPAIRPSETERLKKKIRFSLPEVGIMLTARSTPLVTRPGI